MLAFSFQKERVGAEKKQAYFACIFEPRACRRLVCFNLLAPARSRLRGLFSWLVRSGSGSSEAGDEQNTTGCRTPLRSRRGSAAARVACKLNWRTRWPYPQSTESALMAEASSSKRAILVDAGKPSVPHDPEGADSRNWQLPPSIVISVGELLTQDAPNPLQTVDDLDVGLM